MRIARLNLARYGKFTDHTVDFGQKQEGAPDLHVIYGPNEAGKSTLASAVLDLLFGIEPKSAYNFLHPYASMEIRAALDIDGTSCAFTRIKRQQGSLLDGAGEPVSEASLQAALAGLNRDGFRTMFSLDDETLERGGESILASKGDLGQLLFSASAGLAGFSKVLEGQREDLAAFHTPRSPKSRLALVKARLAELKAERAAIDVQASAFAGLTAERDRTAAAYDVAVDALAELTTRRAVLAAQIEALPLAAERSRLLAQVEALPGTAVLPEAQRLAWPALRDAQIALRERRAALQAQTAVVAARLAAITPDDDALSVADRFDALLERRAVFLKAREDLPNRISERDRAEEEVLGLLRQLGREQEAYPRRLLLTAAVEAELTALSSSRSGLEAALGAARQAETEARTRQGQANTEAGPAAPSVSALRHLASVLAAVRADDHAMRLRDATRRQAKARDDLAAELEALAPWVGAADDLARLTVPPTADIQAAGQSLATARSVLAQRVEALESAETEHRKQQAALAALGQASLADGVDHAAIRAARDAHWAAHLAQLDRPTAEAFAAAMRRDDAATSARLSQAADVARLAEVRLAAATATAHRSRADELHAQALARVEEARAAMASLVADVSPLLPSGLSADGLQMWLRRRERALEQHRALADAERDKANAAADGAQAMARLRLALQAAGADPAVEDDLPALAALAEAVAAASAAAEASRELGARLQQDIERAAVAVEAATIAVARWDKRWQELCTACWLGEAGAPLPVAAVVAILKVLTQLDAATLQRAERLDRLEKIERDLAQFGRDVADLAEALEFDAPQDEPLQALHLIGHRVSAARQANDASQRLRATAAEAEAAEAALAAQSVAQAVDVAALREALGLPESANLGEIDACIADMTERERLASALTQTDAALCRLLQVATPSQALELLDAAEPDALLRELEALDLRIADADAARLAAFHARETALAALEAVSGDARAALIEERRATLLAELRDETSRFLALSLGVSAVERALARYRDAHRSSMMQAASEAFCTISRGAYRGLAAQAAGDSDVLIALGADGSSKQAATLSKGTRFQLYLALRVAGHREFARQRPPLPFLCDDIMETFDDFRAEEAFRLLGGMAGLGQVIYLTHHRHLCSIARDVCPSVTVHELPSGT